MKKLVIILSVVTSLIVGGILGYVLGEGAGYEKGYVSGEEAGYEKGYVSGEEAGYEKGYVSGEEAGYEKGYVSGEEAGYEKGYEEGKFYFYYVKPHQRYGVDDLQAYLSRWEWEEGTYVRNKFDCSEMSAYIERMLENEGYHTLIVVGPTPFPSSDGKHAWLLVETSSGYFMPVEAAKEGAHWQVVDWSDSYFDNYFTYDYLFETIEDALRYNYQQFNWWEE